MPALPSCYQLVSVNALYVRRAGRPGGLYQVNFEPGIGQFREFESPRMHSRINLWGFCGQIDYRKAGEPELATLGEKWTSSEIAEPYAR